MKKLMTENTLQDVEEFIYLGMKITQDCRNVEELRNGVTKTKTALHKLKRLFTTNKISAQDKVSVWL